MSLKFFPVEKENIPGIPKGIIESLEFQRQIYTNSKNKLIPNLMKEEAYIELLKTELKITKKMLKKSEIPACDVLSIVKYIPDLENYIKILEKIVLEQKKYYIQRIIKTLAPKTDF
ncbi:MAG: hypothetical protein WC356_00525 [Candidatus Micrarchaeia archaeon]|jgi:Na+/phosphate symporter